MTDRELSPDAVKLAGVSAAPDKPGDVSSAELVRVTVDGTEVLVEPGATLLAAARSAGAAVPTLCQDDRLRRMARAGSAWCTWTGPAGQSPPA